MIRRMYAKHRGNQERENEHASEATMDWLYHPFLPQSPTAKKLSDPSSFTGCLIFFSSAFIGITFRHNVTNMRGRSIRLILVSKQSMLDLGLHACILFQVRSKLHMRINEGPGFSESLEPTISKTERLLGTTIL